jgi:O-antigen/teichoic acid export membrane protein
MVKAMVKASGEINFALADQAVVSGVSFITTVLLARYLGLEEFGRFTLAWLGLFLAQNLQIALVITPMLTIASKQKRHALSGYRGAVLLQQGVLSLAITAFVFAGTHLSGWLMPEWGVGELALPLAALVFCAQWADFARRYHFAFMRPHLAFAVDGLRYASQLALLVGLFVGLSSQAGVAAALYAMAGSALVGAALGLVNLGDVTFSAETIRQVIRRHWSFSRWLVLTAFAQWAREYFVFTAVGALLGLAEVGALRAAQQLVRVVNVPLQGLANIVPVRAGAAFGERGLDGLIAFMRTFVARYMGAIALALVAIALAGNWLLAMFYGAAYSGYGFVVAAYAFVMIIYLVREMIFIMLRAMETTAFELYSAIAGAAVVIVGSYPLVDLWGLPGALMTLALFEGVITAVLAVGLIGASHQAEQRTGAARR